MASGYAGIERERQAILLGEPIGVSLLLGIAAVALGIWISASR